MRAPHFCILAFFLLLLLGCTSLDSDVQKELDNCKQIKSDFYSNQCLLSLALKEQNPEICASIIKGVLTPRDDCYSRLAILKDDYSLCRLTDDSDASCTAAFAIAKNNASMCDSVSEEARDLCISHVAIGTGNDSLCSGLTLPMSCHEGVAQTTKDLGLCDRYADGDGLWRDLCYSDVAGAQGNVSICAAVGSLTYQDECYRKVAQTLADASLCSDISDVFEKKNCYSIVARAKGDASLCAMAGDFSDGCYSDVAAKTRNDSLCGKISDAKNKEACISRVEFEP